MSRRRSPATRQFPRPPWAAHRTTSGRGLPSGVAGPFLTGEDAMRKKASVVLAAVGVAAAAALFGGVLGGNRAEGTVSHPDPAAAARLVGGFAPPGDTKAYVA